MTTALVTSCSLAGLWFLLFWGYRNYRVDIFRQELFEIRDALFDYAAQGNIEFAHPAYGMLRSTLNGYIRFGHRIGLFSAILFGLRLTEQERKWLDNQGFEDSWKRITRGLSPEVAKHLRQIRGRMDRSVSAQMRGHTPKGS